MKHSRISPARIRTTKRYAVGLGPYFRPPTLHRIQDESHLRIADVLTKGCCCRHANGNPKSQAKHAHTVIPHNEQADDERPKHCTPEHNRSDTDPNLGSDNQFGPNDKHTFSQPDFHSESRADVDADEPTDSLSNFATKSRTLSEPVLLADERPNHEPSTESSPNQRALRSAYVPTNASTFVFANLTADKRTDDEPPADSLASADPALNEKE